ncbi:MAG: hypothetical protein DI589_18705 [Shinella sp.]|nr:MAG: hypothetical protein DI589_18705 [Shinella sp.]
MKKTLLTALYILITFQLSAQQESQYTQYMYNQMAINPAYAGSQDQTIVFGQYRTQWIGLDGAPKTANLSINSPISGKGHGLGISIVNDQIGPTQSTYFDINFSYAIELENFTVLYLGVKAGGSSFEIDYNKLRILTPEIEMSGKLSKFSPNIGTGIYIQNDKWYAGLSVPHILESKFYDDVRTSIASEKMHFYLHGGYIIELSENFLFKPAAMFKAVSGTPLAIDVSGNMLYNDKFTFGAAYRLNSSVSALVGFKISEQASIGYAYDYETTNIGNYARGSHEFFIKFNLEPLKKTNVGRNCWCN